MQHLQISGAAETQSIPEALRRIAVDESSVWTSHSPGCSGSAWQRRL